MDSKLLQTVCDQIYKQFPEVKGKKPTVSSYSSTQSLLIFKADVKTPDGHTISHSVRVVVNQDGIISKITTSR
jgi:hypothetical protein